MYGAISHTLVGVAPWPRFTEPQSTNCYVSPLESRIICKESFWFRLQFGQVSDLFAVVARTYDCPLLASVYHSGSVDDFCPPRIVDNCQLVIQRDILGEDSVLYILEGEVRALLKVYMMYLLAGAQLILAYQRGILVREL